MRSMFVSVLAALWTALLCACAANIPAWETVDDVLPTAAEAPRPSQIVFAAPEGTVCHVAMQDGAQTLYEAEDGSYEIMSCVYSATEPKDAIEALTGFPEDALELICTRRFGLPEYQLAWSAATDEGERVYRASIVCDEAYAYALCFSCPAGEAAKYDSTQQALFASFGLYYDETA